MFIPWAFCCLLACIIPLIFACLFIYSNVCKRREQTGERLQRSHSVNTWPCLSDCDSNLWQRKLFSALKLVCTSMKASLMLPLKSTANTPLRRSLAHRGGSTCLYAHTRMQCSVSENAGNCVDLLMSCKILCFFPSQFSNTFFVNLLWHLWRHFVSEYNIWII